jgi:acyl dehydratase
MAPQAKPFSELAPGTLLGTTDWLPVTQQAIDLFAQASLDPDPMHVNPDWARVNSPFRTTIAFGFQTLSYLTYFGHQLAGSEFFKYALNYGFERVRFMAPVPVDSRIRAHFKVVATSRRPDGGQRVEIEVSVEIEGRDKPALVATWLFLVYEQQGTAA